MDQTRIAQTRETVRDAFGPLPIPDRSYLVLMSPRSGSTLLCAHLQKIGYGYPIEAFHFNHKRIRREEKWDIDFSNPYEYIKKALEYQTVNGVFGMKLSWPEFEIFLKVARQLTDPSRSGLNDAEIVDVFFPNTAYIHLKRRDKVKQAISYAKGIQNGIWAVQVTQDEEYKKYLMPEKYDREHIEACLDNLLAFDTAWENYLNKHDLAHMDLWYDDLERDYVRKMREVYEYLGIAQKEILEPRLKKLAHGKSQEWVDRFRTETPWLQDKTIATALEAGDIRTAFTYRGLMIAFQKEEHRWQTMPANRFKRIKKFALRVKRKLSSLTGTKEQ